MKMDPRVKTSPEDLQKQFNLMLKLRDRQEEMNRAILDIRDLRGQLTGIEKRWGAKNEAKGVVEQTVALRKKITGVEEELIQVNSKASEDELNYPTKMNSWLGYLQGAVEAPIPSLRKGSCKYSRSLVHGLMRNWGNGANYFQAICRR